MTQPNDPIYAAAKAKHDAALAEVERWASFLAMYSEVKTDTQPGKAASPPRRYIGTFRENSQPTQRGATLAETERVAIDAIRKAGRALHTRELLLAMESAGVEVGGQDPASTLSARLSRADALWNDRPHGWKIKDINAVSARDAMEDSVKVGVQPGYRPPWQASDD